MKQTRPLTEFRCLSEHTRLYPIVDFFTYRKEAGKRKNPSLDKMLTLAKINMVCAMRRITSRFILNVLIQG